MMLGNSSVAERLEASQKGFNSKELGTRQSSIRHTTTSDASCRMGTTAVIMTTEHDLLWKSKQIIRIHPTENLTSSMQRKSMKLLSCHFRLGTKRHKMNHGRQYHKEKRDAVRVDEDF
jgi:hypothetical protein